MCHLAALLGTIAVGLDAYGMNEHEAGLLADDLDEEVYFQVSCPAALVTAASS